MEYRVLGPLEVRGGDGPLALGGAKQRALLALLVLNANRVVSRERLIDELWGDEPPETAVATVQVYVSRLRKLFPGSTLVTRPPGYVIVADHRSIDVERFERLLADGREALSSGAPDRAALILREALGLWRGRALAEFDEPFAKVEGGRLDELRVTALEDRIEADLLLGRNAELIGELEVLVAENPHRERLCGQLMLALYRSGRQAAALEAYRTAYAAFAELGIEPSEQLRRLEQAILTHDTRLDLVEPGQINLPIPLTPFLGRERELVEVTELLRREDVRLLTLTGPGGTGKTRLALQAAAVAGGAFSDGVWWVSLGPVRDPALVLDAAREALAARIDPAEHIGTRTMLLLFDNFEHLLDAAAGVGSLLSRCPRLKLLVTSREPLHLGGEHEYPVPTLVQKEAIALFATRAAAVDPSFVADDVVASICRQLDNLPLAIELAAARVKALSTARISERLERRLSLLTGGARDLPERQRTMNATIEWSYELLAPDEQRLFARLAVFSGGCNLDAAEEVAAAEVDTLQSLVEKSLLRHRDERYWMLETIREFAHEQLMRSAERDAISARHVEYFLALAEDAEARFDTSDEAAWSELLAENHDNLRAALARTTNPPVLLRFACALWKFWLRRGHDAEGRRWLEDALRAVGDASSSDVTLGLRAAATLARAQGDLEDAERLAERSILAARRLGDRRLEGHATSTLGEVAASRRENARAAELLAQSETLLAGSGDEHAVATIMTNRAYLAIQMADFELAFGLAEQAVALHRQLLDSTNVMLAALNLALAANALGHERAAREALLEAIELARSLGHRVFLASGLVIASAVVVANDPAGAVLLISAAERAQSDLKIELDPVERDLQASVKIQLQPAPQDADHLTLDDCGDLDELLETAAVRALQSLARHDTLES